MDALIGHSTRREVAEILRPDLEGALQAMIAGAHIVGSAGMGERATLMRLAGLPLDRPKGESDAAASKDRLAALAARLERATGMQAKLVESALVADHGHASGTVDDDEPPKGPPDLGFGG